MYSSIKLRSSLVFLAICFSFRLVAQVADDKPTYALLWEITGNDLQQPSYLFGSMHVREGAAFLLPDSMRYYLESCTAFANEVYLDSAMIRMLEVYVGQEEPQVDADYLAALSTIKVTEDFMPPRSGAKRGPSLWASLSRQVRKRQDTLVTYPTFLDAYLMEYARQQGKHLYGLEEIDEHLYETTDEEQGLSIFGSNLLQLQEHYYAGDITEIGYIVAEQGPHFDQMALVPRNYVMLHRMEEIFREEEALFTVVGAAHLPGKTGLVQLLRERGYQVRAISVSEAERTPANRLLLQTPAYERPWPGRESERENYRFALPFEQMYQRSAGSSQQYLAYDIGRGLSYLLMTDRFLPYQFDDFEHLFFTEDGYEIEAQSSIRIGDLQGTRYELYRPEEDIPYYLGYVFLRDQQLYYLQVGAYEKEALADTTGFRPFLEAFSVRAASSDKWISVVDSLAGFAVRLPANYERTFTPSQERIDGPFGETGFIYHAGYESAVGEPGASTWILYGDLTTSPLEPETDRDKRDRAQAWLEEFLGATLTYEPVQYGQAGAEQTFTGAFYEDCPVQLEGQLVQRGNRFYAIIAIDFSPNVLTKKLLPGFQTIPFSAQQSGKLTTVDSTLQVYLPAPPDRSSLLEGDFPFIAKWIDSLSPLHAATTTTDPATGSHYYLRVRHLPALFGTTDTLGLLQTYLDSLGMFYDSVAVLNEADVQGFPGLEAQFYKDNSQLVYRAQLYTAGSVVVEKVVQSTAETSKHPNVEAFFYQDQWQREKLGPSVLSSKADALIEALASDSTRQLRAALELLSQQQGLTPGDAAALKARLLRKNWPKTIEPGEAQAILLNYYHILTDRQLRELDQLYEIAADVPQLRQTILHWLAARQDEAYWTIYFRALFQHTTRADQLDKNYDADLYPEGAVIRSHWSELLAALAESDAHPILWRLVAKAYQEELDLGNLHQLAQNLLDDWLAGRPSVEAVEVAALLACFRTVPATSTMLPPLENLMSESPLADLRIAALAARLRAGDQVKRRELRPLLKDARLRYPCLQILNQFPAADLLPKDLDAPAMARHLLGQNWQTENDLITEVRLDREIVYRLQDESYRAFVFTFTYDGDINRLAVVGLFDQDSPYFRDEGWIDYTDYTISSRRREDKAWDLLNDLRRERE